MNFSVFYCVALAMVGVGAACMRDTDVYTQGGGDNYAQKRTRRLIGVMLFLAAVLSLGIAVVS